MQASVEIILLIFYPLESYIEGNVTSIRIHNAICLLKE